MNKQKQYKSMRGKIVDMDLLRKKNELTPAIGNARVNARGDELGPGGKIIRKREQIVREHYDSQVQKVRDVPATFSSKEETVRITEPLTEDEQALMDEEAEWVEDEDGNFVAKGE